MVMLRIRIALVLAVLSLSASVSGAERTFVVNCRYLNIPVSHREERHTLTFKAPGVDDLNVSVRIAAADGADYWVFKDLAGYKGQRLTLLYDGPEPALDRVFQADTICGASSLYMEPPRPRYHFTTRRGWINDPNGLVWHDGEYHLYYQHNPYETEWGNMHWGHAVSRDLLHWEELDDVLFPDRLGTMFSGSAVFDRENSSGFGTRNRPPLVFAYTADGEHQTQCIAYSLDGGRTLHKYKGNPVIDSNERWNTHDTRDPRLLWYGPAGHWVMVLFERDGHSFYTSKDLRHWTFRSHIRGFWECPDLFGLPVDGDPGRMMWVLYGASGTYMLGDFDGATFTPSGGKHRYCAGTLYAAQTYSEMPDGRRIQIGWSRISIPQAPFNGQMLLPTELSLCTTPDGVRLFSRPAREIQGLYTRLYTASGDLDTETANRVMESFRGEDCLHIRTTFRLSYSLSAGLDMNGLHLVDYDTNHNLLNGYSFFGKDPSGLSLTADIFIDRASVEVFADDGLFSYSFGRSGGENSSGFRFWGGEVSICDLQVDRIAPTLSPCR